MKHGPADAQSREEGDAWLRLQAEHAQRLRALWSAMLVPGPQSLEPLPPAARRLAGESWSASPLFDYLRRAWLEQSDFMQRSVEAWPMDDPRMRARAAWSARQWAGAMSPENFFATNPEAQAAAIASGGESIVRGLRNLLDDVARGRLALSDESAFEVGRDLAVTPGAVVHQNRVMQLIQYAPQTPRVASRPLLMVPPCINRYYILDLRPENSLVRHLVEQGFTVFMVSWVVPGPGEADLRWDDYVSQGVLEALDAVRDITRARKPNALGFCIGGTLLASALAAVAGTPRGDVGCLTLMTTLLDFADAGELGCFVDEATVAAREQRIGKGGLLAGQEMAAVFASLRASDLIWQVSARRHLRGEPARPFDLLFWNADATHLPGPFASWYLRHLYLENAMAEPGRLKVLGTPLDLRSIRAPAYLFAAEDDHIVPWRGAYRSRALLAGPTRFVLGASGHIAGAINPALTDRRHYRVAERAPRTLGPDAWFERARCKPGSWWKDWTAWLRRHGGREVSAPARPGNERYDVIEPAPGSYVRTPLPDRVK